jgi:hypothetical protein
MTDTASQKTNKSQRTPVRRETASGPHLTVRYWKRMRIHKVYPVTVSSSGEGDAEPVTVRLLMAGAQVVPAEQPMDVGAAGETVTFYVTPLAKGYLRGERLEVLQGGRKIQEIRMPSRVTSQWGTVIWLFWAFFIPWLLLHYFEYSPVGYQTPIKDDGTEMYVRKPWEKYTYFKFGTEDLLPDRPSKKITDFVKDNTLDTKALFGWNAKDDTIWGKTQEYYEEAQQFPEGAYVRSFDYYKVFTRDMHVPLPLIIFLLILLRALISFWAGTQARRRVYGKPLPA